MCSSQSPAGDDEVEAEMKALEVTTSFPGSSCPRHWGCVCRQGHPSQVLPEATSHLHSDLSLWWMARGDEVALCAAARLGRLLAGGKKVRLRLPHSKVMF